MSYADPVSTPSSHARAALAERSRVLEEARQGRALFVLLALGALLFLACALTGCGVTRQEHAAFVDASQKFRDAVVPAYRRELESLVLTLDAETAARVRANREGMVADFDAAILAATERAK